MTLPEIEAVRDIDSVVVESVSAGYGEGTVLFDISMQLKSGTVTALLGANGAGKSTLLSTISGLIKARSGRIRLNGTDVTSSAADRRARQGLCHITDGRGIYRGLTVRQNIVIQAGRGRAAETEAIEQAVDAFPVLGQRLRQLAGSLSGGEQQMLALSSVYIRKPSVILVDEPSLGLAPIIVDEVFEFLRRVAQRGVSLLVVDQYPRRVLELSEQAYVLRRGNIVYSGSARNLLGADLFDQYLGGGEVTA